MASLQHLRTSTDSKRPIPAAMAAGQLALGLHTNSPGAFFKDTNGGLVKIGPVHVGTTAPNASPASEAATATVSGRSYQILTVGNTDFTAIGASANTVGTIFTASGAGSGTGTVSGLQGNSKGESWLDTSVSPPVFKVFNGTAFVTVHPPHLETNTTTPPSNPVVGQLWWNKDDGRLYVYMNDGSSAQWVDASPDNQQLFWTRTGTRVDLSNSGDVVTISGGSASAPGLAVAGDLDTGISSSSANTLGISTGGTQRLLIDSSGRLGIATNSPSYKLHVAGAGTVAYFEGSGGSGFIGIEDTDDNTSAFIGVDGGSLKFQTSGNSYSDKLVIDSSGNVGVGTTSNYDDSVLEVRKTAGGDGVAIRVTNNTTTNGSQAGIIFTNSTDDFTSAAIAHKRNDNALIFYNGQTSGGGGFANASERMRIDHSGRLLVGTTNARTDFYSGALDADIQIEDSSYCAYSAYVTNGNAAFIFGRGNPISGSIVGNLSWMADDGTDEVEAARISAQIDGTPGSNSMPGRLVFSTTASGASSTTERMRISQDGNVQISMGGSGYATLFRYGTNEDNYITSGVNGITAFRDHNNSERMRIDSSGRLLVGTTSASLTNKFLLQGDTGSASNGGYMRLQTANSIVAGTGLGAIGFGDSAFNGALIEATGDVSWSPFTKGSRLEFSTTASGQTSPTVRMRISNQGDHLTFGVTNNVLARVGSSGTGGWIYWGAYGATNISSGTQSFGVYANGNVVNTNNSYGPLSSDERLKQDITDANSQWADIKNIRITNFHYKNNPTGHLHIGPIAQELEQVSPGLVTRRPVSEEEIADSSNDLIDGDEVLSFKASILYMKAVKALQEAMERIETLEAKIAALVAG